jgi:hypothetical protein
MTQIFKPNPQTDITGDYTTVNDECLLDNLLTTASVTNRYSDTLSLL